MASASIILFIIISCLSSVSYAQTDTLKQGHLLRDWEQLVSAGGVFRLGFFSPNPTSDIQLGSAGPRHLGIWFDRIPFYSVWVANRADPVPDSSGALTIDGDGKLRITHQGGQPIIINSDMETIDNLSGGNITATLLDSGNLVIQQVNSDGMSGPVLWQSFDYPHNMLLPGMKLGMNLKTGYNWTLTSWLSERVPAPGAFRLGLDPTHSNQLRVWRRDEIYWSSGVWQNGSFESAPELTKRTDIYDFRFVSTEDEKYFTYSIKNKSVLSRWDLDTLGEITVFTLDRAWIFETTGGCRYGLKNSTAVCLSEKPTKCRKETNFFVAKRGYIVAKRGYFDYNVLDDYTGNVSLSDCHAKCWKNCTCVAYQPGSSCRFWSKGSKFRPDDYGDFIYILANEKN